jgi:cation diffusion facilitator family transporter
MEPKNHIFLGEGHEHAEKRTWWVIWLCGVMMLLEIVGGLLFGSIALVADGLHMSTHAGALLLAALAYSYARRHATDARFTFGTGKLGDLAGFTSAIVLAMIALLIGWEAVSRLLNPVPIAFAEAIPIACLGLAVNVVSAWLLSGGGHDHHHHGAHHHDHDDSHTVDLNGTRLILAIHEDGVPPRFRIQTVTPAGKLPVGELRAETIRSDGTRQIFAFADLGDALESVEEIPEPHEFNLTLTSGTATASVRFEEHAHAHDSAHRDNNMRAAVVHVMADAAVSVLVIVGLLLARAFGWLWMDPLAGIIGACVIASWAYGLVRDTGRILMDMNPDPHLTERLRREIETDGDRLTDLHVWRLGPGHLAAELTVSTDHARRPEDYHQRLRHFRTLSHVTIEVHAL